MVSKLYDYNVNRLSAWEAPVTRAVEEDPLSIQEQKVGSVLNNEECKTMAIEGALGISEEERLLRKTFGD
jgi:hypothetical protein